MTKVPRLQLFFGFPRDFWLEVGRTGVGGHKPLRKQFQNRFPLRIKPEAVSYLSSLRQFRDLHTVTLIKLAYRRTGLFVPSRWVAISLLRSNLGPIPVADLEQRPKRREKATNPTTRAKLILIKGGHLVR